MGGYTDIGLRTLTNVEVCVLFCFFVMININGFLTTHILLNVKSSKTLKFSIINILILWVFIQNE